MAFEYQITFGTSALDRDAALRLDAGRLVAVLGHSDTRILPIWRGKPAVAGDGLVWLAPGHPALAASAGAPIYLGRVDGVAHAVADLSDWEPPAQEQDISTGFYDPTTQHHPDLSPGAGFVELRGVMTRLTRADAELAVTARALTGWHRSHRFCSRCGAASDMAQGGWQRVCPACGAHHFPRTDPVVIMLVTRGNRLLLGRSPGWPEGMYSCLAGFVEPGETLEAAVRREVLEEAGIACGAVRYVGCQPWPYPSSLMIGAHAQALDDKITIDPVEIEDAIWISREEMVDVVAGTHPAINAPRRGAIAHALVLHWLADSLE